MKRIIIIVLVGLIFILTTAQIVMHKTIGGFEILGVRVIYKISQKVSIGDCKVTHYWWVDEWGRPINEENYSPKEVLSTEEILQRYFEFLFPIPEPQENPFQTFKESGA
jgi:hypothetical protein